MTDARLNDTFGSVETLLGQLMQANPVVERGSGAAFNLNLLLIALTLGVLVSVYLHVGIHLSMAAMHEARLACRAIPC